MLQRMIDAPSKALSDVVVLDLTRVRSGPTCVRQLADWGAHVIKVELPENKEAGNIVGPREGFDFQNLHRNKQSMTLDMKDPEGLKIFMKLVAEADVVVENFRPNVKKRLGINFEELHKVNEGIILASISGFGQDGPYVDRPGFDQIAQGMGGLMSITGEPGKGPMRVGIPIADLCAGLFAFQGIMVALHERQHSGQGQWVQTSLLQAQLFMLDFQASRYLMDGEVAGQAGNNHPTTIPTGVFPTKDGYFNLAVSGEVIWQRLCHAFERSDWIDNPHYLTNKDRSDHREALNAEIAAITATRTTEEWVTLLNDAGVPCGEINNIQDAFENPQVKHLGIAQPIKSQERGDTHLVGQPFVLSRTNSSIASPPPTRGQHTEQILEQLGFSQDDIQQFRKKEII